MLFQIFAYGTIVGLVHFFVVGLCFGNPWIKALYASAQEAEPGVRVWPSRRRYLVTQFLGTQVEVYVLATAFFVLRSRTSTESALTLGLLLAGVRVFPRFWNMWIQSTYPRRLLAVEVLVGTLGTLTVAFSLQWLVA
jgi:hypothetical protein